MFFILLWLVLTPFLLLLLLDVLSFPYSIRAVRCTWKFWAPISVSVQETFGKSAKYTAGQKFAWGPKLREKPNCSELF